MKKEKVILCKDCLVEVKEYNDQADNSHYQCPKCKKVLFYGGDGELEIINGIKTTTVTYKI